jgi:hypothetical protein
MSKHTVVAITAGAFLFSTFLTPQQRVYAIEGGTSGSTPPSTPTSLSGTATTTPSPVVDLTWTQPPASEFNPAPTRFVIYRVSGSSPNFSGASPLAYTADATPSYQDSTVSYGTYNYKVAAQKVSVDGFGFPQISESANSNIYTVTLTAPTSTPTSTPTSNPSPTISASLSGDQRTATVSWALLPNVTFYRGYRKLPNGSSFEFLGQYSSTTAQFTESGLVLNGGLYTYKIAASFSSGSDTESNEASVRPSAPGGGGSIPTPVPLSLTINATTKSSSQIDVSWPFVPDTLFYYVYSGPNATTFTKVGNGAPGPTNVTYEHKNLTPGTTYYYKVEAYNGAGLLVTSNIASATTLTDPTTPVTPTSTPTSTPTPTPTSTPPVVIIPDECGTNDRLSPVRITNPNSGIKFPSLPGRALFKPGENTTFTYCYRNTLNHQVQLKVRRSLVNNKTFKEYASSIGTVVLEPSGNRMKADRFSFNRSQDLERSIPLGEYRVRIQVIDETATAIGDEPLPVALNQVDENSFIFLVDNDQPLPPPDPTNPPPLLKPSDPTSDIKFTQLPKQSTFWAGQGMKVSFTYKNNSGGDQNLTLLCSLLDEQGNLIDQQRANLPRIKNKQTIRLTSGKGCVLPGMQPLSLLLPSGYYTFRAEVYDKEADQLITSNSFNFRVVKRK